MKMVRIMKALLLTMMMALMVSMMSTLLFLLLSAGSLQIGGWLANFSIELCLFGTVCILKSSLIYLPFTILCIQERACVGLGMW